MPKSHAPARSSKRTLVPPEQRWMLGALALVVAVFIAYIPAMNGKFIWDDDSYVTENHLLHDVQGLRHIWIPGSDRETRTPQYYPVVFTTFWIEYQLWHLDARGYHQMNVLLHALCSLLVWRLCVRIGIPGGWLIAAIFALHPVHVESVAWITERKNVLSGLFYLAAMLAYLRFDGEQSMREAASGKRRWNWYAIALVLFVLALLSKSVTCSLPAALILVFLYQRKPLTWQRLTLLVPFFAIGLALALNTAAVERDHVGASGEDFVFTFAERLIIASKALLFYPQKLLWPWPVMFIYPRWEIDASSITAWIPVAAVGLIAIACVVLFIKGYRAIPLALAFFAGTVFPALGFVNIYPMIFSFVADHFQYLASLGIIALIGATMHRMLPRRALIGVSAIILLALGITTWRQATTYENAATVYRDTLSKNPNAWMPHNNLANIILPNDPAQAEYHYRESLRIRPNEYTATSNLAEALRRQERYEEAIAENQKAIAIKMNEAALAGVDTAPAFLATDYDSMGRSLRSLNRLDEAEAAFLESINIAPGLTEAHFTLTELLAEQNRLDDAVAALQIVVDARPNNWRAWRSIGVLRARQERFAEARHAYEMAMKAATEGHEIVQVAPLLVRLLSSCPDEAVRDIDRAMQMADHLCEITGWQEPALVDVLASVLHDAGRTNDAIKIGEQALALARQRNLPNLAQQISARVEQYRATINHD